MILNTTHRRGVQSPTRDLIHSNLPVSRETRPWGLTIIRMKCLCAQFTGEGECHGRVGCERAAEVVNVEVMAGVVTAYCRWVRAGGVREGHLNREVQYSQHLHKNGYFSHVVITAFSVRADVKGGAPDHKLLHVQSDGADVGAGLLEGVDAGGGVQVAIRVAGALNVGRVLRNSAATV